MPRRKAPHQTSTKAREPAGGNEVKPIKSGHQAIKEYYNTIQAYEAIGVRHEGALEIAFQRLLVDSVRHTGWTS